MWRFILHAKLARLRRLIAAETDTARLPALRSSLASVRRELALRGAGSSGLLPVGCGIFRIGGDRGGAGRFQQQFEGSSRPILIIDPGPGLHIVDMNDAYARATMTSRENVVGDRVFSVFPDNPDDPYAEGISNAYASFRIVGKARQTHVANVLRYDIRDPSGLFVERYWSPVNSPVLDEKGRLLYLLHQVEDVTDKVL